MPSAQAPRLPARPPAYPNPVGGSHEHGGGPGARDVLHRSCRHRVQLAHGLHTGRPQTCKIKATGDATLADTATSGQNSTEQVIRRPDARGDRLGHTQRALQGTSGAAARGAAARQHRHLDESSKRLGAGALG